ncbi:AAA family ATPase [Rhizobium sp. PAMB 3182]
MNESDYDPELIRQCADRFFVLTGCSGGGKSTLLSALAARGFVTYPEPGRQIVREQQAIGGDALPGENPLRFVELVLSRAIAQRVAAAREGRIAFFDRGPVDALAYLEMKGLPVPPWLENAVRLLKHNALAFVVPPWPEIFRKDAERRHDVSAAMAEYEALLPAYRRFGYRLEVLERTSVESRAERVAAAVNALFPHG